MKFEFRSKKQKNLKSVAILETLYPYILGLTVAYFMADLGILNLRPLMLPKSAPPAKPQRPPEDTSPNRGAYNPVISRNIFSWDGIIPDPLKSKDGKGQQDDKPTLSTLPLNLIGTIVSSIPERSVATIEIKGKLPVLAYRAKNDIENLATLVQVERNKIIFRNLTTNHLEYIENKDKTVLKLSGSREVKKGTQVEQVGVNQFQIKRSDLNKNLKNLASLLQQAASAPHKNAQGEIDGFTVLDFKAGSIYEQLGVRRMDIIRAVNGESLDSPEKAMALYQALKSSDRIKLSVERSGKVEEVDYSISE